MSQSRYYFTYWRNTHTSWLN